MYLSGGAGHAHREGVVDVLMDQHQQGDRVGHLQIKIADSPSIVKAMHC